jgi:DNA (cytosine-5)-methyltransferase 1
VCVGAGTGAAGGGDVVVGSLFAGIGGFDLAARWMGWRTAWVSEIDPFACQVLAHHFHDAPNHGDITQIDFTTVEPVDVLVGGFPCQDISNAGKQAGITGTRSGLWFHYARAIRELRPRYVVVENVAALTNRGLDRVLGSLAEIGYDAEWGCFGAADVGAPHKRDRLWLLAYPHREQQQYVFRASGVERSAAAAPAWAVDADVASDGRGGLREPYVADAEQSRWEGRVHRGEDTERESIVGHAGCRRSECEQPAQGAWAVEPDVGRLADGIPHRVAQLRALGNAIVPQCATVLYEAIAQQERAR